jgi:hypothetical protein
MGDLRRCLPILWLLLFTWLPWQAHCTADDQVYPPYQLKAAYLFNFAKLTTWPTNSFLSPAAPIRIAVLGQNPFGLFLSETIAGKTIAGRSLVIEQKQFGDDLTGCHLLFISTSEKDRLPAILESLRGKPILSVSEIDKFAESGGMIGLFPHGPRIRFRINIQAIDAAGLQVSSKLGALGQVVKTELSK